MSKIEFPAAVDLILSGDRAFAREAYYFLRDALDFTIKQRKKAKEASTHVTGQQLLEGIRVYALKQFGPMVPTVLGYWGVERCEDFGVMVYQLIETGVFGKTERDSIDDFKGAYTFHQAFVAPYLPAPAADHRRMIAPDPARELN